MAKKLSRKSAIKALITSQPVENQGTLVELLKNKYGIMTNQSIVSRDLRELNVSKQQYKDTMIYELKEVDVSKEILRNSIISIEHNEVMMLVTVLPGVAAFVGDYIDANRDGAKILGTIAGENMIFVMPVSIKKINDSYESLCALLYYKPLKHKSDV